MTSRLLPLHPNKFAAFSFVILEESDRQEDVFSDEQLFDVALIAADDDVETARALCGRFIGFIEMAYRPEAVWYVFDQDDRLLFHPALFEAAATVRTRKNGSFPDKPFFRRVAELAGSKYADFEFEIG